MLHMTRIGTYLALDEGECLQTGRSLADSYRTASPFPHIVVDDFLEPDVLRAMMAEFPSRENKAFFDRDQERLKYQFQPQEVPSGLVRNIFAELNSAALLGFLEELTGIVGLISDPHFAGGGLHETRRGGHLGVHADFNVHGRLKLERRLNLLIYLNEDWADEYGGELELWDQEMEHCAVRVKPVFRPRGHLQYGTRQLSWAPRPFELPGGALASFDRDLLLYRRRGWPALHPQTHDQFSGASSQRRQNGLANP